MAMGKPAAVLVLFLLCLALAGTMGARTPPPKWAASAPALLHPAAANTSSAVLPAVPVVDWRVGGGVTPGTYQGDQLGKDDVRDEWPGNYNDSALDDGIINATRIVVSDSFDLVTSTKEKYAAFLSDLDYHVSTTAARLISGHPLLGQQQLRYPPATWFQLTVTGNGGDQVDFFMRSDNLYISGFTNTNGRLFAFLPKPGHYRMAGSTLLSFGSGYPDFFGDVGARGLLHVEINKEMALRHLATLANFQGGADEHLKIPAAFFVLVIAEAERFAQLRLAVAIHWDQMMARSIDYRFPGRTTYLIDLVTQWRTFSCAVLSWDAHGQTPAAWRQNGEARYINMLFGIASPEGALITVHPILQPAPWRCTWSL